MSVQVCKQKCEEWKLGDLIARRTGREHSGASPEVERPERLVLEKGAVRPLKHLDQSVQVARDEYQDDPADTGQHRASGKPRRAAHGHARAIYQRVDDRENRARAQGE